jgi:mannosyltransferase OCH1-like enzyme
MKKKIVVLLLLMIFHAKAWLYIPFDEAMQKNQFPDVMTTTKNIFGIDGDHFYNFFKDLYELNNLSVVTDREARIPKIIHQIWLGSDLPQEFIALQQSWIRHHLGNGWHYKLWTDADVAQQQLYNQQFYDATDNFGTKSDILRWEIIYRFGGIYVDMDMECLRSLDELLSYDFFISLHPLDTLFVQSGTALFGAIPGHPILKHCIQTVKDDWHLKGAPSKTGPVHFTKSFYATAGKNGMRDIALPAYYFYPLGCRETTINKMEWKQNGAYAVHWWAKSWMPKDYRPAYFTTIHNDASVEHWND